MTRLLPATLALVLVLGCATTKTEAASTPSSSTAVDVTAPAPATPEAERSDPLSAPPDVAAPPPEAQRTAVGLASKVLRAGNGTVHPGTFSVVRVHYSGWTTDGKLFDSSVKRGAPAEFPLNGVIAGWKHGVKLMVVGEKRRLWIPEELAYKGLSGPQGMLVFEIELLEIVEL